MSPHPVWVKVEVEGEDGTMHQIHPGDSYVIEWTVHIDAPPLCEDRVRHIRITVPQEGVKPPDDLPWMHAVDDDGDPDRIIRTGY